MKQYELPCLDSRKSFYGKAQVIEKEDGSKQLKSYSTIVCSIDASGAFHRHWIGESATTIRHINSFLKFFDIPGGGVAWWREQPVIEPKLNNPHGWILNLN
jgi:hypothetical protein